MYLEYKIKYVNAFPISDLKATAVAQPFCERFKLEQGVPEELFSAQGRQYDSNNMSERKEPRHSFQFKSVVSSQR